MDSITHTLFGLALYGTVDKTAMDKNKRRAFLVTALGASHIPDIDIVSQLWDTEGLYQMWHRGITHSIFLTPVWALVFVILCLWIFKVKDLKIFFIAWLAVSIHDTSDLFNAWGTGYLEPFSQKRITFGTIPIVDFVFWSIIAGAFILTRYKKGFPHLIYRGAWLFMFLHVVLQSTQGYILYHQYEKEGAQIALSAGFFPSQFTVIKKNNASVSIFRDGLFQEKTKLYELSSAENANLDELFRKRPKAKTLYQWSPFVVIVDDEKQTGIYDPRFYRNGQSFLFEYVEKNGTN